MCLMRSLAKAVLVTSVATLSVVTAAPVVTVDQAAVNTVTFRDYAAGPDSGITYGWQTATPAQGPSQNISGGTSTWTYPGTVSDPRIQYDDGLGAWDHAAYPWSRLRFRQSRTTIGATASVASFDGGAPDPRMAERRSS